jgi:hypothetical protein
VGSICRLIMCPVWVARSRSLGWSLYGSVGIQVEVAVCIGVCQDGVLRWVGGVWASLRCIPGVGERSCMRPRGWWIIHSRRWVYASFVVRGCSVELFWLCVIPRVCCVLGDVPVVVVFYFSRGTACVTWFLAYMVRL